MNYLKLLFFYSINVVDSLINLVCAVFHYYPSLDMAQEYLVARESDRIEQELAARQGLRVTSIQQADAMVDEVKHRHAGEIEGTDAV